MEHESEPGHHFTALYTYTSPMFFKRRKIPAQVTFYANLTCFFLGFAAVVNRNKYLFPFFSSSHLISSAPFLTYWLICKQQQFCLAVAIYLIYNISLFHCCTPKEGRRQATTTFSERFLRCIRLIEKRLTTYLVVAREPKTTVTSDHKIMNQSSSGL